jgi:purine catabolism regulator
VRDVLRFDEVARSLPEILSGEEALDRPVRWVHISETTESARLVSGDVLVLSTGAGWPSDDPGLRALAASLISANVAGLVLELGERMPAAPAPLVDAFRAVGLPFVVLHREVRFIAITEAVHSRIIADQMDALRARADVHTLFTELSLRGSPADFIVAEAGRALAAPVVLEDLNHRVVAASTGDPAGTGAAGAGPSALRDWEQRSRAEHRGEGAEGWLIVPVEARGMRWGHLIALPGRPHPAGRSTVIEQAAVALALSRLADRTADEWMRHSHEQLLGSLLGRRFASEEGLAAGFEASGFPVAGRRLTGVAIALRLSGPDASAAIAGAVSAVAAEGRTQRLDVVVSRSPEREAALIVLAVSARTAGAITDAALSALARSAAAAAGVSESAVVVGVGSETGEISGLLPSLAEAEQLIARSEPARASGIAVIRADDRPLLRLVSAMGGDPRMQEHSEHMLRPLIEYDLANGGDLLAVLRAYVAHPGNRTKAAAASHLSRSVFYQRLALIERLLGHDLDDGETLSALHAALLARSARR